MAAVKRPQPLPVFCRLKDCYFFEKFVDEENGRALPRLAVIYYSPEAGTGVQPFELRHHARQSALGASPVFPP